jgi:proteasome lid subunit RPN8/RPN11
MDGELRPVEHEEYSIRESGVDGRPERTAMTAGRSPREQQEELPDDWPLPSDPPPIMRMTHAAYGAILRELTSRRPEYGGMLLGPKDSDVVTHFVADENGLAGSASFTLDAAGLNRTLREFRQCGLDAKGLVHSHPHGMTRPSAGDLHYVQKALANPRNREARDFHLPIVCNGQLYPYVISRDCPDRVLHAVLILV